MNILLDHFQTKKCQIETTRINFFFYCLSLKFTNKVTLNRPILKVVI